MLVGFVLCIQFFSQFLHTQASHLVAALPFSQGLVFLEGFRRLSRHSVTEESRVRIIEPKTRLAHIGYIACASEGGPALLIGGLYTVFS